MDRRLITFQSLDAFKDLVNQGFLECREEYVNTQKSGFAYSWMIEKMNARTRNDTNTKYPLWCWVKCHNHICPPKRRGEPVRGFDVKITFHKPENAVFITDFRRYSFLLNNTYIPDSLEDKRSFDDRLAKLNITEEDLKALARPDLFERHRTDFGYLEICREIRGSFDRCITMDSDILQGCVWRINLDEVEKIEFLNERNYRYGSLNYKRSDGKRLDWRKDFYKRLPSGPRLSVGQDS